MAGKTNEEIANEAQALVDHLLSQYEIVSAALVEVDQRCALCDRPLDVPGQPFSTAHARDCRRCHLLCNRRSPDRILICGLPGAGKSTLAHALAEVIPAAVVFDADDVRARLWPELGYSPGDRQTQAGRMAALADMAVTSGCTAICSFVAPTQQTRDLFGRSIVIWVDRRPCRHYSDTTAMWERPAIYHYRVVDDGRSADEWAEEIAASLG